MLRILLVLPLVGCTSNKYSEGALKLMWQPPPGVALESEGVEGGITTAHFSGGVDVRSVTGVPLPSTGDLDQLRAALVASSKIELHGDVRQARSGSVPAGPTARWEMQSATDRSMLYYVTAKDRYVLISLVAAPSGFDRKSNKLELSMSSLKLLE